MALAAPGALFPLMALFWWLDSSRYGVYSMLYAAGKSICLFSAALWCVFSRGDIIDAMLPGGRMLFMIPGILLFMLPGDMLSVAAAFIVINKSAKGGT
jgi:hypothetical protein